MSFADLEFLDTSGLPRGLSEQAYATWRMALRDLYRSQTEIQVEHAFQFCRGFVQALQDMQVVEPEVCLFLEAQVRGIWIERVSAFQARGH
ncbi:hypothetical protein SFA35_25490 (plasmid) [Pseudomonas sp. HR96]|uniref:hypothetical protein n=1 Tax=Pseudomonas sp. HR96 TaxID=1027966 RepID=UPI002A76543F|nr:hypothetical protein [Pseudomonas sp. HR96]WPP02514.1 hypothetical protein SFA35_25490 [Pseudomonas sp. HR96]